MSRAVFMRCEACDDANWCTDTGLGVMICKECRRKSTLADYGTILIETLLLAFVLFIVLLLLGWLRT